MSDGLLSDDAGRIHLIYGSRSKIALPTQFVTLENASVPGSGSFVVNRGTGRPESFPGGDLTYTFEQGQTERWLEFSTLGDGSAGDGIRILTFANPSAPQSVTPGFPAAENIDGANWNLNPDPNITDSTSIPHTSIRAVGDDMIHDFSFYAAAGSRGIFDIDENNFTPFVYLFDGDGNELAFNEDFERDPGDVGEPLGFGFFDAFIDYSFETSGTYVLRVVLPPDQAPRFDPNFPDRYTLHVSVEGHSFAPLWRELEPNDSFAFPQNLDHANWNLNSNTGIVESTTIPHITLAGTGDGTFDYYAFTGKAGARGVFDIDGSNGSVQIAIYDHPGFRLQSANINESIDFVFPASGKYYLRVENRGVNFLDDPLPLLAGESYTVNISVSSQSPVIDVASADLVDVDGHVLSTGTSAIDLRTLEAGTYYLRVSEPIIGAIPFSIQFDPPIRGNTHESTTLPDRDEVHGGDGDDYIVGNFDLDRLYGNGGVDTFVGEPVEIRDRDVTDKSGTLVLDTELSYAEFALPLDPVAKFTDPFLERIVADALGLPATGGSATVGAFTGGANFLQGLDLDGNFLYAVNVGGPAVGTIRDADFTAGNTNTATPGVTVAAQNLSATWLNADFGVGVNDDRLESVMNSIRWSANPATVNIDANVIRGRSYKLQLLFAEVTSDRAFDIFVEGQRIVGDFNVQNTQGGINILTAGAVVTYEFVAPDNIVNIVLNGANATAPNKDPILSGFTLEQIGNTFQQEFRATELATITKLDASDRGITNVNGIEHLTNLLTLDLSNNQLDSTDMAKLVPRRLSSGTQAGELVGLAHLQELTLNGNTAITDIASLATLTELRSLKLEGTGVNASANNTTSTLLALPDLRFLTMPNRMLRPGQNLVFDEGDQVNLLLADPAANTPWQVFKPWNDFAAPVASGTGTIVFDTTDNGLATLRVGTVFPVFDIEDIQLYIRNVAPTIQQVPDLIDITEGQTLVIEPNNNDVGTGTACADDHGSRLRCIACCGGC